MAEITKEAYGLHSFRKDPKDIEGLVKIIEASSTIEEITNRLEAVYSRKGSQMLEFEQAANGEKGCT